MDDLSQKINNSTNDSLSSPQFTISDMMRAGVHFGHRLGARNPKVKHYLYGEVNKTHIIDVRKSYYALQKALDVIKDSASKGKRIVFVSTVERFEEQVKDVAAKSAQYYVRSWKGGMLTNWRTTVASIKTLHHYDRILASAIKDDESDTSQQKYTKKELVQIRKKRNRLHKSFGGIADMDGMPDLMVVLSVHAERLAITETLCIGTPVIGIVDTNSDPTLVQYPIPGNDDSLRVMKFYCNLFVESILEGTKQFVEKSGLKAEVVIDSKTNLIKTVKEAFLEKGKGKNDNRNNRNNDRNNDRKKTSKTIEHVVKKKVVRIASVNTEKETEKVSGETTKETKDIK
ncbi:MAG: 30S ribosomal protein S2 [Alphaproteobacteria bacterium]|nr:30S ribosomal protein S2 [Rickettsiales bacterium]